MSEVLDKFDEFCREMRIDDINEKTSGGELKNWEKTRFVRRGETRRRWSGRKKGSCEGIKLKE